jgi:MFS family permease
VLPRHGFWRATRVVGVLGAAVGDLRHPLAIEPFRWLWLSSSAWNLARWMELVVTGWVALELTRSPALVALLGVTRTAMLPIAGPISGALADRVDRGRLLRAAQWTNAAVFAALAIAVAAGAGAFWQLVAATLWLGLTWGIDWPARRALAADLVGQERVLQVVVLDSISQNTMRIAGALAGGVLLAGWGGSGALVVLALLLVVAAATLPRGLPGAAAGMQTTPARRSMWRELLAGLRYARRDEVVRSVLLVGLLMDALLMPYQQLLAVFAERVLEVGPVGLGQMGAATGAGAALGLGIFPALRSPRQQARAYVAGCLLAGGAVLLFAASRWLPLSLALLVAAGLGTSAFGTMQTALLLARAPGAMRGRVLGLQVLTIGGAPLGALALSLLVERLGVPLAVALNAVTCAVLVALVAWRSQLTATTLHPTAEPA